MSFLVGSGHVEIVARADLHGARASANQIVREVDGTLRDSEGRFVRAGQGGSRGFGRGFGLGIRGGFGGLGFGWIIEFGKKAAGFLIMSMKGFLIAGAPQIITGLVTALAPAIGAIGILPAVAGAAALAMFSLKLAFSGVGDALKAGLSGDTEKFNEAIKKMPPTAQQAMKAIVGLRKDLDSLKFVVQGNFWGQFGTQIQGVGKTYLPMLSQAMGAVSFSFGQAVSSFMTFLKFPDVVEMIRGSLTNMGGAIDNVAAGLPNIAAGFVPLISVGSTFLPGLTSGFQDVTERFANFMDRAAASGELQTWISNGLSVLGSLGQLLGQIGGILSSVFTAASAGGGNMMGMFGALIGQVNTFLSSAEGMSALTGVFQVLAGVSGIFGQVLGMVLPVLGMLVTTLSGPLSSILPIISGLLTQLSPVIAMLGQTLSGALAIALPPIIQALQTLAPVVGTLVGSLAVGLAPAITAVAQIIATLVPIIMPVVQILLSALVPVIQMLAPIVTMLGQVLGQILGAALQALMPLFNMLIPILMQLLTAILTPLTPILALVGELFMALMPAITPLVQLIATLLNIALIPLTPVIQILAVVLQALIQVIIAIVTPIANAIGWVVQLLNKFLESQGVTQKMSEAFQKMLTFVSGVINWLKDRIIEGVNNFKANLLAIGSVVMTVIGFFQKIKDGVTEKVSALISFVSGIPGRIMSAVGNLGSLLYNAGRDILQGLLNGISDMIGKLKSKLGEVTNLIPDWKGPMDTDRKLLTPSGRAIMQGLSRGIDMQLPALRAQLSGITASIPTMTAAPTALAGAGGGTTFSGPINLTIDPTKFRTIQELLDWVSKLQQSARSGAGR